MNKREQRKQIEKALRGNAIATVWQDKPYTAVHLVATYNGITYDRYGFAKVQYPDEWDAKYGIELAIDKAIAKISKEIVGWENA